MQPSKEAKVSEPSLAKFVSNLTDTEEQCMSDPILQAEANYQRVEFIQAELVMCFTFATLATMKYEAGSWNSAALSLAHGEEVYAVLLPLLLDPSQSKYLTIEQIQEFTTELERLRESLDRLHRLKDGSEPNATPATTMGKAKGIRNGTPMEDNDHKGQRDHHNCSCGNLRA